MIGVRGRNEKRFVRFYLSKKKESEQKKTTTIGRRERKTIITEGGEKILLPAGGGVTESFPPKEVRTLVTNISNTHPRKRGGESLPARERPTGGPS